MGVKTKLTIARVSAALTLCAVALPFVVSSRASADPTANASASIGVLVNQPTTTVPPATTTTVAPPATTTPPTTDAPATTVPPTTDTLPDVMPAPQPVNSNDTGFVAQVKSAAKTTKDLVSGVLSGKPVAEVAQQVLPQNVATVVVPAVRTASTFVFPIGLAVAVIAFLALQARIDAGDPKLSAAPLAHDDDVVEFS